MMLDLTSGRYICINMSAAILYIYFFPIASNYASHLALTDSMILSKFLRCVIIIYCRHHCCRYHRKVVDNILYVNLGRLQHHRLHHSFEVNRRVDDSIITFAKHTTAN